jgi:hypothetical protein
MMTAHFFFFMPTKQPPFTVVVKICDSLLNQGMVEEG